MKNGERMTLLQDVESFCQELRPSEERCYLERRFNDKLVPLARKYNLLGMPVPREYGGRGADVVTYALAVARIGREGTGVRTFFSGHSSLGQYPILTWGNDEQKSRFLPVTCRGEVVLAFGLTELEAGSNPLEMRMTHRRRGEEYLLSGNKYMISNAGIAGAVITFAYPEGRSGRISAFLVATRGPGFTCEPLAPKIGNPTADTAQFELTDYAVPAANLLGEEGNGLRIALGTLTSGRLSVAAGCLGVIEDCLAEAVAYAKSREQYGKPIARHQLVQEQIAAIEMDRVTTEAIVIRAAEAKDASAAEPGNDAPRARADLLAAQAKLHASHAAWDAADRAVQVFGGRGVFERYRPGRHLQDVRVCRIYEGTDEILKLKVAAAVLGKEFASYR